MLIKCTVSGRTFRMKRFSHVSDTEVEILTFVSRFGYNHLLSGYFSKAVQDVVVEHASPKDPPNPWSADIKPWTFKNAVISDFVLEARPGCTAEVRFRLKFESKCEGGTIAMEGLERYFTGFGSRKPPPPKAASEASACHGG